MGKRIITIDAANDGALRLARANHRNAVLTNDVGEFVRLVLTAAGGEKISRPDVIGHGHPGLIYVGGAGRSNDGSKSIGVNVNSSGLYNTNMLRLLEGAFEANAFVRLHACRVAQGLHGQMLLWQLADLWKVRVQGAVVTQFPDNADRFEGSLYVESTGSNGAFGNVLEDHPIR